jgi:hypothetical protein
VNTLCCAHEAVQALELGCIVLGEDCFADGGFGGDEFGDIVDGAGARDKCAGGEPLCDTVQRVWFRLEIPTLCW